MVACSMRRQFLAGRSRPATAPGKPILGAWPKPTLVNMSHISCGLSISAILVVPMLLECWMTWPTVSVP